MFHESHSAILGPALFVVVAHDVLVVGVRVLSQVALDEFPSLLLGELEHHEDFVDVPAVKPEWMTYLLLDGRESHKFMRIVVGAC
jgi:hypothetical protein